MRVFVDRLRVARDVETLHGGKLGSRSGVYVKSRRSVFMHARSALRSMLKRSEACADRESGECLESNALLIVLDLVQAEIDKCPKWTKSEKL